jgi:hypothetical protein
VRRLVRRWWNRRYGSLGRCDVAVWTDDTGTRWAVEVRHGGADGRSRWREVASEQDAFAEAERCREAEGGDWLDISPQRDRPGVEPG